MSTGTINGRIDTAEVRAAAAGKWFGEILPAHGFDRDDLDGTHGPCPKCGGGDRFRAIDAEAGAVYCNQCFSEDNGDGFAALMWLNNWNFPQARNAVADTLGIRAGNNGHSQNNGHNGKPKPSDIVADMARAKRIPLASFIAFGAHEAYRGKLKVARVPMYDAFGKQCSYCDFADISPEFLKGMSAKRTAETPGVGLYYATAPEPGDTVLITEGPKDAAALHSLGFKAVGMPTCKLAKKFARLFIGCHVVLVPDLDTTGEESTPINAARLAGVAKSIRIVRLPGEMKATDGDGVREVLAQTDGEALVRQAIEDAQPWEPERPDDTAHEDGYEWTAIQHSQGRTDLANSRRFLKANRERVRHCFPWSKWLVWDGPRWQIDENAAVLRLGMATADEVWMAAKAHLLDSDVLDFAKKTSGHGKIISMLKLAAADVPVAVSELDSNKWLLNCPNGTLDLRTGQLKPHRREDHITKLCPTNFKPDASSYHWDRFLETVFGDDLTIRFLQRLAGYFLTGEVSEQILAVFHGAGSNGKSTLLNALQGTLGADYTSAAPPSLLMEKKTEAHPTELAGLFGKRLVIAQETNAGARLAESTVKQLTGGDMISARRMREDFWTFSPTHKLVICSNHKPRIKGTDHAIWRRVVLLPFERRFWNPAKGEEGPAELIQDKALPEKLAAEHEGILAWMVQGCLDWQRGGLQIPDSVRAATEDYRSEQDILGQFLAECCDIYQTYRVKFSSLYETLEGWCNESGANLPSRTFVGEYLKDRGFRDKQSGVRWYLGIGLKAVED